MDIPDAEALLRLWEEQHAEYPINRALALLDAVWPEVGARAWAQAPIGERNGWLLRLYELLFGTQLYTVTRCPQCDTRLESDFTVHDMTSRQSAFPKAQEQFRLSLQSCEIDYRLPNSEDLLQVRRARDEVDGAALELLRRCVLETRQEGSRLAVEQLSDEVVDRLMTLMESRDPGAEANMALVCPECDHHWTAGFDIAAYLWEELDDWAQQLLADVHVLASAYGWREPDILALSPTRRQLYLDMVAA